MTGLHLLKRSELVKY